MAKRITTTYKSLNKTASGQSARSHQKDLAKISGKTAGVAAVKKTVKAKGSLDEVLGAYGKAKKKATKSTMKSFKKSK